MAVLEQVIYADCAGICGEPQPTGALYDPRTGQRGVEDGTGMCHPCLTGKSDEQAGTRDRRSQVKGDGAGSSYRRSLETSDSRSKVNGNGSTPIEPLEPLRATTTTLGASNGSMGALKGSVGPGSMGTGSEGPGSVGEADEKRLDVLGIPTDATPFACKLPGHDHDATVTPSDRGFVQYMCPGLPFPLGLAEIRAWLAYAAVGVERDPVEVDENGYRRCWIGTTECARWRERLDYDAGQLTPRPVSVELPPEASKTVRCVADGWRLLVALRGLHNEDMWISEEPFTFARRFVQAWCRVSDEQAKNAVRELKRLGVMVPDGTAGKGPRKPITYRPGPATRQESQ